MVFPMKGMPPPRAKAKAAAPPAKKAKGGKKTPPAKTPPGKGVAAMPMAAPGQVPMFGGPPK